MACRGPFENCHKAIGEGSGTSSDMPLSTATEGGNNSRLTSVSRDKYGYGRCGACGRFASQKKAHICPISSTPDKLRRALSRRLKIPPTAYDRNPLASLLRQAGTGDVAMRHPLSGNTVQVGLDGLALALSNGYQPDSWNRLNTSQVVTDDGRVLTVHNPAGMTPYTPDGAVSEAAAAYGAVAPQDTGQIAGAAALPSTPANALVEAEETSVTGGVSYDTGHFIGTEYRKRSGLGTEVEVKGQKYTVGSRSQDPKDFSSARLNGDALANPRGGVAVGRTLVGAIGILADGAEVQQVSPGVVELHDKYGNLVSVYDHNTGTAGDKFGTPNASAEQTAAIIGHHLLHPDMANPLSQALVRDFAGMQADPASRTPLAVADSAYLVIKEGLDSRDLNLGGTVSARRCPDCGRWIGQAAHQCPAAQAKAEKPAAKKAGTKKKAARSKARQQTPPVGVTSATPVNVIVNEVQAQMDAGALGKGLAQGFKDIPPQQVDVNVKAEIGGDGQAAPIDSEKLAEGLAKALQNSFAERDQATVDGIKEAMTAISETLTAGLSDVVSAVQAQEQRVITPAGEVSAEWMDKLMDRLDTPRPTAPSQPAAKKPKPKQAKTKPPAPRQSNAIPDDIANRTSQEHIFANLEFPAPDPLLQAVPDAVGGQLAAPIAESIPKVDPYYEVNEQTEGVLRMMSAVMQQGMSEPDNPNTGWTKSFLLYGSAGSGKDTAGEQLAASMKVRHPDGTVTQGMNFWATTFEPNTSMESLIGATVLEADPETGATRSRLQLGPLAQAAAMGSVICLDEIPNLDTKSLAVVQDMMEKRTITINSPEGGIVTVPVHPSTVFISTMNPGYEGGRDRPGLALLSRMTAFQMEGPSRDEAARRIEAFFARMSGDDASDVDRLEKRRKEILENDYNFAPLNIKDRPRLAMAAATLNDDIARLARREGGIGGQIGLNSDTPPEASIRMAYRFAALADAVGPWEASKVYDILCDQDDTFSEQRRLIDERVEAVFGPRGAKVDAVRQQEQGAGMRV